MVSFFGNILRISKVQSQNLAVELIEILSSGECAPLISGPYDIISIPGYFLQLNRTLNQHVQPELLAPQQTVFDRYFCQYRVFQS